MGDGTRTAGEALSRTLSRILRHNPDGLPMDAAGWVDLDRLGDRLRQLGLPADPESLAGAVAADPKGRFEIDGAGRRMRARSGHSIAVDLGLPPYEPEGDLFFGTVVDSAERIDAAGLTLSRKTHVRLLDSYEAALAVAEARGLGGPAVYRIDARAMRAAGAVFLRASNGEILAPPVAPEFIERVDPAPAPGRRG